MYIYIYIYILPSRPRRLSRSCHPPVRTRSRSCRTRVPAHATRTRAHTHTHELASARTRACTRYACLRIQRHAWRAGGRGRRGGGGGRRPLERRGTCCLSTYVSDCHSHTSSCPSLALPNASQSPLALIATVSTCRPEHGARDTLTRPCSSSLRRRTEAQPQRAWSRAGYMVPRGMPIPSAAKSRASGCL